MKSSSNTSADLLILFRFSTGGTFLCSGLTPGTWQNFQICLLLPPLLLFLHHLLLLSRPPPLTRRLSLHLLLIWLLPLPCSFTLDPSTGPVMTTGEITGPPWSVRPSNSLYENVVTGSITGTGTKNQGQ